MSDRVEEVAVRAVQRDEAPGRTGSVRAAAATERDGGPTGAADQRREQMLRAALDVIAERGYPETRIADVAERAGTSPALVIYYFKTKDQLLTEAIRYSEDGWYREGLRRLAALRTAAERLEEFVAMNCLPEEDPDPRGWALLWLDLWAQAARNPDVAATRQKAGERWRETIESLVVAGQEAGEFGDVNPEDFASSLSSMLDGFAVQLALHDPVLAPERAFELGMSYAAGQLGFDWSPGRRGPAAGAAAGPAAGAAGQRKTGGSPRGGETEPAR